MEKIDRASARSLQRTGIKKQHLEAGRLSDQTFEVEEPRSRDVERL